MYVVSRFVLLSTLGLSAIAMAAERTESFDSDPGWEGINNRPSADTLRTVVQNFGYTKDGPLGACIGGTVTPDGTPAYYAKAIPPMTFSDAFSASGMMHVAPGGGNTLLGFFNHTTVNEWRTPNSLAFRINGRGDFFHMHSEYATSRWRAGASVIGKVDKEADRVHPLEHPGGKAYPWSISYDPDGNDGGGTVSAMFAGETDTFNLSPGHKEDGATFDRFGILNAVKSVDGSGDLWINDLVINGERQDLATDPKWEGVDNRLTHESGEVRPRFDFGFAPTHLAGGAAPGEIGGLFFRGDCREAGRMACYGDRLDTLTLEKPLRASGTVALQRGVTDSTTLFGFYHNEHSMRVTDSQRSGLPVDFLGFAIEGPSGEGFYVYPLYRVHGNDEGSAPTSESPRIFPDGTPRKWSLEYDPSGPRGGVIRLTLDGESVELSLPEDRRATGATFDRFGFVTPWIDGNGQRVYLDDLTYTWKQ